jgi:hypothetical protein
MSVFLVQDKKYFPDEKYIEGATNKINKESFDEEDIKGNLEKIECAFDDPTKLEKCPVALLNPGLLKSYFETSLYHESILSFNNVIASIP